MEEMEGLMEQPEVAAEVEAEAQTEGSIYGKFKDATSMLKAYKNLEAEFTRKSQRVAELERKYKLTDVVSEEVDALSEETKEVSSENTTLTAIESADWKERVDGFFKANPSASEYKSRMARILHENPDYILSPKCLEIAYSLAKTEGLKQPAELLKDQQFIDDYVLNDSRIKDIIINSYIKSLSRGELPKVISGNSAVHMATPKPDAPRTIKEAGRLAQKYLG